MKSHYLLAIIISLFIPFWLTAQELPTELKLRLKNKKNFYEIKSEVVTYYRNEKLRTNKADSIRLKRLKRESKFWNRWLHYAEGRLDENGEFAGNRPLFEAMRSSGQGSSLLNSPNAANASWTLSGPSFVYNGIGRVDRIGFHPTDPQIIYAGTARGGLFRTVNGGANWSPISAFLPFLGISGIVVDSNNPNTIYVLTGEGDAWLSRGLTFNFGYVSFSNGVMKSTDGGATWWPTAEFSPGINNYPTVRYVGFQLRQDPNNSNKLFAATSRGIFYTYNGGNSWLKSSIAPNNKTLITFDIEFKPGSSTEMYAVGRDSITDMIHFYTSINGGVTFFETMEGDLKDVTDLGRCEIGVTPADPNYVYLLAGPGYIKDGNEEGSEDKFKGFYRSTNSGATFTRLTNEPDVLAYNPTLGITMGNQQWYDMALAVSPYSVATIFTGGLVVFRSTNGGISFSGNTSYWFTETGDCIHPDVHDLKYNPLDGKIYAATDGGVAVSANDGNSWTRLFNGLSITQFYHIEPDNENDRLWGGAQDNGILERESGSTFTVFEGGDGFDVMTDNIVGNGNDSYWTTNGGLYTSCTCAPSTQDRTPPIPDGSSIERGFGNLAMHTSNEDYIYVGYSDGVWYSNDQGSTWTMDGNDNRLDPVDNVSGNWTIESCPSNTARLYSAGSGNIWRITGIDFNETMTGTATSIRSGLITAGFPSSGSMISKVNDIAVSPSNSNEVWVVASGFSAGNKVYYSSDGGGSWTNISGTLPNVPANTIVIDGSGGAYVGMDIGVYYRSAGAGDWLPFYNGLPYVPVSELVIDNVANVLRAGTYGRGIWFSALYAACEDDITLTQSLSGQKFYQANSTISSTSIIQGGEGTKVFFRSGNSISLTNGFHVNYGNNFNGYITSCGAGGVPLVSYSDSTSKYDLSGISQYLLLDNLKNAPARIERYKSREGTIDAVISSKGNGNVHWVLCNEKGEKLQAAEPIKINEGGRINQRINIEKTDGLQYKLLLFFNNEIAHWQEIE